ncbi:putative zinc metalloprotease Rip3 [Streptomyces spinoverrucosus]|uniref:Zinc metalloprotease n=1 Tax=Streptomyces spinoverrucosus TaxID=284043 RepID=A0A4Y3VGX6_9ACTN|nr:site-2 protease family protein [Streptomyces spinoverrucosus]GEC05368.1 putative zinc metalloprotease Rip3 [Streptomyces spinoverrucosus]GHB78855.1 zinc metalloprotease [Streptomyces spinoverrucosus]
MKNSLPIGRVSGVPLRIHWTVPLLVFLFGYGLAGGTLPAWLPGRSTIAYTVAGLVGALLLLLSLLAHESAHAVTARRKGITVHSVTLWALGGMTEMEKPTAPGAAFLVAVSGPLTSLIAGGAALGAGVGLSAGPGWQLPAAVLVWLGWANLLLAVFNLLPAAPLDGGRVVQAVMWWRTGDRERAERTAGRSGQILGILLIVLGWLLFLRGAWSGLWLALIGFFVVIAAKAELQQASLTSALKGLRATDAMSSPVETAHDWMTVQRFIDGPAIEARHSALPLLDFDGSPSGLLRLPQLTRVPAPERETLRLRDVATPLSQCTTCAPDDLLEETLKQLRPAGGLPILVLDGRHLTGIITAHDIIRLTQRLRLRRNGAG